MPARTGGFGALGPSRPRMASRCPDVGLGLLVLTFGVFVGNSTVQIVLRVLRGFLNLLELPVVAFYLSCVGAAACTLIQNGYLTRTKWPSAQAGYASFAARPSRSRSSLSGRLVLEVSRGRSRTPRSKRREREKTRRDVFGVLDFWAG